MVPSRLAVGVPTPSSPARSDSKPNGSIASMNGSAGRRRFREVAIPPGRRSAARRLCPRVPITHQHAHSSRTTATAPPAPGDGPSPPGSVVAAALRRPALLPPASAEWVSALPRRAPPLSSHLSQRPTLSDCNLPSVPLRFQKLNLWGTRGRVGAHSPTPGPLPAPSHAAPTTDLSPKPAQVPLCHDHTLNPVRETGGENR